MVPPVVVVRARVERRVDCEPGVPICEPGVSVPPSTVRVGTPLGDIVPVAPMGVVVPAGSVPVPITGPVPLLGTTVPGWPGTMVPVLVVGVAGEPGVLMVPGAPTTGVWAWAEKLRPSPSRAALKKWEAFIIVCGKVS